MIKKIFLLFLIGGLPLLKVLLNSTIEVIKYYGNDILIFLFKTYITSPYAIVRIIMLIVSGFGIWIGFKNRKVLFTTVSFICEVVSIISFFC